MPATRKGLVDKAVESCLDQTMDDIEVLVGDCNGCFGGHPDKRVRHIPCIGLNISQKMNKMVDLATSDICMFCCDDDLSLRNRAELVYNGMKDCDVFAASYVKYNQDGKLLGWEITEPWDWEKFKRLETNFPLQAGGFRKSTCPKWDSRFLLYPDVAFLLECHRHNLRFGYSDLLVYRVLIHDGQDSGFSHERNRLRELERRDLCKAFNIKDYIGEK
jgi:glycosyltransferase involved in cell wall biosynthesis